VFTDILTWENFVANTTPERYLFPSSTGTRFNGYFQDTVKWAHHIITLLYCLTRQKKIINYICTCYL
jgi:hypothetical protein